ncbi:hypothetical protein H2204_005610 [Knufia peltigerae]|uniref:Uncharacterized protein n=1 Tax=Knufia peltigerae TaxID=1002370 RepID=A0AA39CYJ0_9EURO|nr:hypothetical protein H2204_005610 [Knufia peltigerae]
MEENNTNQSTSNRPTSQDDDPNAVPIIPPTTPTIPAPKSALLLPTNLEADDSEQGSGPFQFAPELFIQTPPAPPPLHQESVVATTSSSTSQTGLTRTTTTTSTTTTTTTADSPQQGHQGSSSNSHQADSDVAVQTSSSWRGMVLGQGPRERIRVGDEVFILDMLGNSIVSTDTIRPAQLLLPPPQQVGGGGGGGGGGPGPRPRLLLLDSPSIYMMVGTLEIEGVGLAYHFVPTCAGGQARAVWRRESLVKVRFRPGERVRYTEDGREWEALVESAEVVADRRRYNLFVPGLGSGRILVTDELLRALDTSA